MGNSKTTVAKKKNPESKKKNQKPPIKLEKTRKKNENNSPNEVKDVMIKGNSIDFCEVKLNPRQRCFLIHYLTPGIPTYHNALQAAIKCGYSEDTAKVNIYRLLREPDIQKIIKANEVLAQQSLHEAAKKALEIKKLRAFYDPIDFFDDYEVELESKSGDIYTKTITGIKDLKKISPELRLCIDGLDVKGQASIPVYNMPDRAKELNDIIKLDSEYSKETGGDGDDEEETMEIIMERLTLKKTLRKAKDEIFEAANLEKQPIGKVITEL